MGLVETPRLVRPVCLSRSTDRVLRSLAWSVLAMHQTSACCSHPCSQKTTVQACKGVKLPLQLHRGWKTLQIYSMALNSLVTYHFVLTWVFSGIS